MAAGKLDLTIEQGATFEKILLYKDADGQPIDLTGYNAELQVRSSKDSTRILLELSTDNSKIGISGETGQITLLILASETSQISWSEAVYDLKLISDSGFSTRLVEGKVKLSKAVTR